MWHTRGMLVVRVLFISIMLALPAAQAAHVIKHKDHRVLVQLDGLQVRVGELFYVMHGTKRVSVIEISQARDGRAIAKIRAARAGKTLVGGVLKRRVPPATQAVPTTPTAPSYTAPVPRPSAPPASPVANPPAATPSIPSASQSEFTPNYNPAKKLRTASSWPVGKTYFGPLGGMNYTRYTLKPRGRSEAKPKGLGFMGQLFVDHSFARMLNNAFLNYIRVAVNFGWELAKGTGGDCEGDNRQQVKCDGKIHYFTLGSQIYFEFLQSLPVRPWLGFRYGAYYPLKLDTNYFKDDTKTLTSRWGPVVGVNIMMGSQIMISVSGDWGWFPSSDTVGSNSFSGRIGFGFSFQ